jgi:PAS domain S-box-containing protein
MALNPLFGTRVAFIMFFPAVVFGAWVGGWLGGLTALVLSTLAAVYFFINPNHSLVIANHTDQLTLVVFVVVGLSISAISSAQHKAHRNAADAVEEAERSLVALRESETRKSAILEVALDCIITIDADGKIVDFNPAAEKTFGCQATDVIGQPIAETIIPASLRGAHHAGFAHYLATGAGPILGQRIEVVGMRSSGEEFPVEVAIVPMQRNGAPFFTAYLRDISERKALEQERERIAEREHHIAEQLQEALQPAIPRQVPGLELADYYQPALEEAGVGGDFLDVFAADKGITFLVAGDLSGKGLAAASQVSIVRNMLRFALYNGRTLNGPVTTLSRTLVDNDLLTGFATLFVGRYAAAERELSYVNCGQDAALVLRSAAGLVESLPPTGPVLGAFPEAEYAEETVRLEPGDVLAIFTDGLTEAGPSRTALLTGDGVAALLRESPSLKSATEIVSHLISGVDAHAQGGTRDDQCLLVGVVA